MNVYMYITYIYIYIYIYIHIYVYIYIYITEPRRSPNLRQQSSTRETGSHSVVVATVREAAAISIITPRVFFDFTPLDVEHFHLPPNLEHSSISCCHQHNSRSFLRFHTLDGRTIPVPVPLSPSPLPSSSRRAALGLVFLLPRPAAVRVLAHARPLSPEPRAHARARPCTCLHACAPNIMNSKCNDRSYHQT